MKIKCQLQLCKSVLSRICCFREVVLLFLICGTTNVIFGQTGSTFATIIPISSTDNTAVGAIVDYHLTVKNSGSTKDVFSLETSNVKSTTNNPDGTKSNTNQDLQSVVLDENGDSISKVEIESGKEIEIIVRVFVPDKAKTGVWNCTQLKLDSTVNPTNFTFLSLFTYAPKPKNDIEGYVPLGYPILDSHIGMLSIRKSKSC